ncbi:MAG TPA: DEAD/DEAH box helicase, partial [Chitinophagaceae bacterium]|nr:DEAD/DEAH box helicase [Chitinophagaceae bacterium]
LEPVKFTCSVSLYDYQKKAVEATDNKDFGIIVAPPGSGKTMMALSIIAHKQQPALIIVHRKQLFDQWIERIQSFLKIPKFKIGKIESGKCDIGGEITVAMIQSLQSENLHQNIYKSFGTIIVDECHHIPAKTFREVIRRFYSYYLYGFTATPFRKNKDEKLIFIHIGEIIHEVILSALKKSNEQLSIIIQDTELCVPFNVFTDKVETLLHILIHDTARNELIVNDIKHEAIAGRKILVLTERKAHVEIVQQYLKGTCETIILTGDDNEQKRKSKLQQIEEGNFQVLIATGQLIGEGTDLGMLNCLILAYPFSFEGKLVQYIGRVQRSEYSPVIYDYRDQKVDYLDNLFKQRNKHYRKLAKAGQLTRLDELILIFSGTQFYINTAEVLLSIDCLELPIPVEGFKPNIIWKLRVIDYNEENGELFTEIIDYNFPLSDVTDKQISFYFYGIEKIRFRNIDTTGFLKSVILKKQSIPISEPFAKPVIQNDSPQENMFFKTMKVPFRRIKFLNGSVSFPIYIEALNREIVFEISNSDIRPEFEAIREYFAKALKKKLVPVEITIRYTADKILLATARSEDIDSINTDMIDSMRFEFVKREIIKEKTLINNKPFYTLDDLLNQKENSKELFSSEKVFLDDLLKIKKSKHYLQLKYLSTKHESPVLKLRFVLQPFSFLFLLSGERKYHIVWETLDSEEATYIWHIDKNREALRNALTEIECVINEIKQTGRQNFLQKEQNNFSRIVHEYTNPDKGFVAWKGLLEERIT